MSRVLLLAMLLASFNSAADSIYRTTDAEGNVVFTDAPNASSRPAEQVEIQRTNTVEPPPNVAPVESSPAGTVEEEAPQPYTVTITNPADETSFPMGPGNFSVSVRVSPALKKYEGLQLFVDGEAWGSPQRDTMWDLINVFRGQHDITVAVVNNAGETITMSDPVRVYVHRPSTNFKNR
ncbi:MAG: DUF4124 domain-containing protein [Halioglobus sp.]|nr:DUF4124 domain-containing protein [Halioglobus sp.]